MPTTLTKKPNTKWLTWNDALDLYETHLRAVRWQPRSVETYLLDVSYLRERVEPTQPDAVTLHQIRAYQSGLLSGEASRSGKPLAASSVARATAALAGFFTFLADEGLVKDNPTHRLERPRVPTRVPGSVLGVKDVKRLLAGTPATPLALRDRALVELYFATALRRAEILSLDLEDLDAGERVLTVMGKGGKGRLTPVTRSAWNRVADYLERGRPALASSHSGSALFLSATGRRFDRQSANDALTRMGREAGLKTKVTPRILRRSCATALLKAGTSLKHIQALLGHVNLSTTAQSYLRLDTSDLRRELLLKHPRERLDA